VSRAREPARRRRSPALLFAVAAVGCLVIPAAAGAEEPTEVRVGLLAFEGQFEDWSRVLGEMERVDPSLRFRLALGTYAEMLHWMEKGWIDVAVLSPALFALGQDEGRYPRAAAAFRYVATIGYPPASPTPTGTGAAPGYRHTYRSVCVVPARSPLRSFEDVRAAYERGRLVLVFGHPLSTSGRIAPEHALRRAGLLPDPSRIEYAQSHTNALLRLDHEDGVERVAFVYDGALDSHPEIASRLRVVPFPELDERALPWDVVVARSGPGLDDFRDRLLAWRDERGAARFEVLDDWQMRYAAVRRWEEEIELDWDPHAGLPMSLDEIGAYLEHSRRTQPDPPRLALVLSGGGARCSYQVGALAALEEELQKLNGRDPDNRFDIDLVVGTSGGAINALPVALGITATPEGRRDFEAVWTGLDQREIIRFSPALRASIGLWFGLLRIAVLVLLLKLLVRRRSARGWWAGGILVALAILEGTLRRQVTVPWSWLGDEHLRHHAWLWLSQGQDASVVLLAVAGGSILVAQALLRRRGRWLHLSPPWATAVAAFALVMLPLASGYRVLLGEETLSRGEGIDRAMAEGMSFLIGRHVERVTGERVDFSSDSPLERLRELSRIIDERSLVRRDLIITASCLRQTRPLLPDDIYFWLRAEPTADPSPLGLRGVALSRFPERVMEAVMGSGSIFPLFPARTLTDFPVAGESVDLVDGGFAHNSPIEAAVLWGATHIVLIEASPPQGRREGGLAANVVAAVQHYARQTEQVDRRSSQEVVVFTLSPEEPHPCLLDFADNLIRATIDKGYHDACGVRDDPASAVSSRRFVKQAGKPVFAEVPRRSS